VTVEEKDYVVMTDGHAVLGVYRIKNDGVLKRLRRWPIGVESAAGWLQEETA
jgi:hypothetical protein